MQSGVSLVRMSAAGLVLMWCGQARANDVDGDGVDDTVDVCPETADNQTDTDGDGWGDACVHPSATVSIGASLGVGAYVGENSFVGTGTRVGDYAQIGRNSVVSSRVQMADGTSASNGVIVGDSTIVGRVVRLGVGANVTGATIGRAAVVEAGANVQQSSIGYASVIGTGVVVEPTCVVGNLVRIESGATVAAGAVIARSAQVLTGASVGASTVIGPRAIIGAGASVGANARLRKYAHVQQGASVGAGARLGRGVVIGRQATVAEGVRVLGCSVAPNTTVNEDLLRCTAAEPTTPQWQNQDIVTHPDGHEYLHTERVVDASGNITVAWMGDDQIHVRRYEAGVGWGDIHTFPGTGSDPQLGAAADGTVALTWRSSAQVVSGSFYRVGSGWGEHFVIADNAVSLHMTRVTTDGHIVLVYPVEGSYFSAQFRLRLVTPDGTVGPEQQLLSNARLRLDDVDVWLEGGAIRAAVGFGTTSGTSGNLSFGLRVQDVTIDPETGLATTSVSTLPSSQDNVYVDLDLLHTSQGLVAQWRWSTGSAGGVYVSQRSEGNWVTTTVASTADGEDVSQNVGGLQQADAGTLLTAYMLVDGTVKVGTYTTSSGWQSEVVQPSAATTTVYSIEFAARPDGTSAVLLNQRRTDAGVFELVVVEQESVGADWTSTVVESTDDTNNQRIGTGSQSHSEISLLPNGEVFVLWPLIVIDIDTAGNENHVLRSRHKR